MHDQFLIKITQQRKVVEKHYEDRDTNDILSQEVAWLDNFFEATLVNLRGVRKVISNIPCPCFIRCMTILIVLVN